MNVAILVTGDRYATDQVWGQTFFRIESEIYGYDGESVHNAFVIHGAARGIDSLVHTYLDGIDAVPIPMPYIDHLGPSGGPRRNRAMVEVLNQLRAVGYRTEVMAFHDRLEESKGTKNCITLAMLHRHRSWLIRSDGSRELYAGASRT